MNKSPDRQERSRLFGKTSTPTHQPLPSTDIKRDDDSKNPIEKPESELSPEAPVRASVRERLEKIDKPQSDRSFDKSLDESLTHDDRPRSRGSTISNFSFSHPVSVSPFSSSTDDPPTDDPPTDDPATDDLPTDDPSTDEPPTDDPPTDDSPTDDPPTEVQKPGHLFRNGRTVNHTLLM